MTKESQEIMFEHSEAKVRLLKEYMAAYLGILSNTEWIKEVYLYDLFCGPGVYDKGGEGSPIILLKEIKRADQFVASPRNKPTKFNCLFNDKDNKKIERLKENIKSKDLDISKIGNIEFLSNDYKIVLDDLKKKISEFTNERGFIFIDPYGYSEVSLDDIDSLTSTKKTEVLLFMPTHHMYRFKDNGTPECLVRFLDDLEISSKMKGANGLEFIEAVKDGFQSKLGDHVFVDSFVIKRDLNQFFCLFFFTSNRLGYLKMLEAKWKIDKEEGRGWNGVKGSDLFSQSSEIANTEKLQKLLLGFLKEGPKTSGQLFEFIVRNRFLPKHGTEILKSIQDSLEVIDENGKNPRKGAFYITFDTFQKNPGKATITLK